MQGARRAGVHWFDLSSWFGSDWEGRAGRWLRQSGLRVLLALALGVWVWFLGPPLVRLVRMRRRVERVRRGEASMADATLLYERMLHVLKRHGYHKPPWFTPVEFAASISSPVAATVREFTASYNALRFGGRADVAPRLSTLLDELEKQERRP